MIFLKTWRLKNTWENKKNSHDSSILGDKQHYAMNDTNKQCLGLVSKDPGTHPMNMFQNVIFNVSQWEKLWHSSYKSISLKFSQMLSYLKNIKEDAQIFSACTGSAW